MSRSVISRTLQESTHPLPPTYAPSPFRCSTSLQAGSVSGKASRVTARVPRLSSDNLLRNSGQSPSAEHDNGLAGFIFGSGADLIAGQIEGDAIWLIGRS